ncbi:MAG: glycosyltransferase, partial [Desulfobacca sp.]|uniref:glycosyltransferase n=1 Tax=Desulfobacca sp. TaxID=2067990 RepID=UPI004049AF8C
MAPPPPPIDCVVIGVNAAATLGRCLESILQSQYPLELLQIFYVDGGSSDDSLAIARRYPQVQVIALQPRHPTPGLQRNAGWRRGHAPLVQFLDSDTMLHPQWLAQAAAVLQDDVGAVFGRRLELYPEASIFNFIANLEWNPAPGECEAFGGDVCLRRQALEATGGYDEILISGEDPELSQRLRQQGYKIIHLDTTMTWHDLAMTHFRQYWRRAYRTGYGFAAVTHRHLRSTKGFWAREVFRLALRGGGSLGLAFLGSVGTWWSPWWLLAWPPAVLLLLFPRLLRVRQLAAAKQLTRDQAKLYAWHCSFVVIPEFFGASRYLWGALTGRPLHNQPGRLRTGTL